MEKEDFINYLESKDYTAKTIKGYVKYAENFFVKVKKEDIQIVKPDVLKFLEYLKNTKKYSNQYRNQYLLALKHYFDFLYKEGKIAKSPCWFLKMRGITKRKMYKIFTPEELDNLFDAYYQIYVRDFDNNQFFYKNRIHSKISKERNALALSILINQGVTTTEIEKIELNDVDLIKATLKIRGGTRLNNRTLPLKATQIGLFMYYLQNTRPQLLEYHKTEPNKLFLPITKEKYSKTEVKNTMLDYAFYVLSTQLKDIDKRFVNVLQIRTSVITNWLKTEGLRKTQYLAGHRYVSSTERFLPNNLDHLIDDISKLHPFNF